MQSKRESDTDKNESESKNGAFSHYVHILVAHGKNDSLIIQNMAKTQLFLHIYYNYTRIILTIC